MLRGFCLPSSLATLVASGLAASLALAQTPPPATPAVPPVPAGPTIVLEVEGDVLGIPAPPPILPTPGGAGVEVVPRIQTLAFDTGGGVLAFSTPYEDTAGSVIHDPRLQKELEIVDEQLTKMRKVYSDMHAETRRVLRESRQAPREGQPAAADIPKRIQELQKEAERQVQDILLPHQQKRLQQIALRKKMRSRGTAGTLTDDKLAKELDITDAQKDRLRKKAEEVQKDLEQKIAKLRAEARQEILSELTDSQRRKLDDLLGDEFDDSPPTTAAPRIIRTPRTP